jgi:hypothetical protein
MNVDRILEITFTLIILYLVLSRAEGFSEVVRSISSAYIGSVKTLQGR